MDIDKIASSLRSFDQLSVDAEDQRLAMQRLRSARWAMPTAEAVFPKIDFTAHDFNQLVENKCFMELMTRIRRTIYDKKIDFGFGAPLVENVLIEGLAMAFGIFDDIEREVFSEDDSAQPSRPSPQEDVE